MTASGPAWYVWTLARVSHYLRTIFSFAFFGVGGGLVGRLPFPRGPFVIAACAGVPVIPVQVACTPRTLAREIPLHRMPLVCARYSMRQFPPYAVLGGRTSTMAATQTIQNLLQALALAPSDGSQRHDTQGARV